jgi:DNA polymerase III epsilon subunit-like protein
MKYVSIDIETTGLNEDTCDIIEFAAVLDDLSELSPIERLPIFHTYFIKDNYVGEPYALSMHPEIFRRIAERDIKKYSFMSAQKLGYAFRKFLVNNGYKEEHDQVVITAAGKNFGAFDLQFLKRKTDLLKHVNIRHRIIDPAILYLKEEDQALPGTEECKLRARIFGKVEHTAEADAKDVVALVRHKIGNTFIIPF